MKYINEFENLTEYQTFIEQTNNTDAFVSYVVETQESVMKPGQRLLTFYIDSNEYSFTQDMTWGEWIVSEYNENWECEKSDDSSSQIQIYLGMGDYAVVDNVTAGDKIIQNNKYTTTTIKKGGSN